MRRLGRFECACDYHEQALAIAREVGDRRWEGRVLQEQSVVDLAERRYKDAATHAKDAVWIGEEVGDPAIVSQGNRELALALLGLGDLPGARAAAEAARLCDVPMNNHNVLTLLGLIALRQGDHVAAAEAFEAAISHAGVMLERCDQNYEALDAKGLALAGLAMPGGGDRAAEAIAAYRGGPGRSRRPPGSLARVRRLLELRAPAGASGVLARRGRSGGEGQAAP